jgi:hypothetical protein
MVSADSVPEPAPGCSSPLSLGVQNNYCLLTDTSISAEINYVEHNSGARHILY